MKRLKRKYTKRSDYWSRPKSIRANPAVVQAGKRHRARIAKVAADMLTLAAADTCRFAGYTHASDMMKTAHENVVEVLGACNNIQLGKVLS